VGDETRGDVVNVTLPLLAPSTGSTSGIPMEKQLLKIQMDEGARCTGPESEGQLKLFNIYARNPTESHIIANCLVKVSDEKWSRSKKMNEILSNP